MKTRLTWKAVLQVQPKKRKERWTPQGIKKKEASHETGLGVVTPYSNKMAYPKEKKQFHPVRHMRLSEENMQWLERIKKGTWNHTFNLIKQKYGEVGFQKLPNKKAGKSSE